VEAGALLDLVLDGEGRTIELSVRDRLFTAHQRKVLAERDGGCVIEGRTAPTTWCEAHHVQEHRDGEPTSIDNGCLLCLHHHRELGALGWQIRRRHGMPWIRPPAAIDPHRQWRPGQTSQRRLFARTFADNGGGLTCAVGPEPDGRSAPTPALFNLVV